jgi:3-hydroxymyristoyl/3-hydroxydecanoyl-(acyl carrier protein) dehydratase
MSQSATLRFSQNHPAMAGHFPGNPIVPGALLLDEVLAIITGTDAALTIRAAKFLHPIRPGETINLRWQTRAGGDISFECRLDGRESPAMTGTLAHPAPP